MVHHIVVLKFKAGMDHHSGPLFKALEKLRDRLPGITSFAAGPYSSPEGANQGYTHGFVMMFTDTASRDAYLIHPEHEAVKAEYLPFVESVIAFDF